MNTTRRAWTARLVVRALVLTVFMVTTWALLASAGDSLGDDVISAVQVQQRQVLRMTSA